MTMGKRLSAIERRLAKMNRLFADATAAINEQGEVLRKLAKRTATKADVRKATATILHGDAQDAKPGPRLNEAKRRQIAAASNYRETHRGCSLHNVCVRSFKPAKDGYSSGKSLYRVMLRVSR